MEELQGIPLFFSLLISEDEMSLAEGTSLNILATNSDIVAFL